MLLMSLPKNLTASLAVEDIQQDLFRYSIDVPSHKYVHSFIGSVNITYGGSAVCQALGTQSLVPAMDWWWRVEAGRPLQAFCSSSRKR